MIPKSKIEKILNVQRHEEIIFEDMDKIKLPAAHVLKHSWAGDKGIIVYALNMAQRILREIAHAEDYYDNGRLTSSEEEILPEDYLRRLRIGEILVYYEWDDYNNPINRRFEWHVDISDSKISAPYTIRIPLNLKKKLRVLGIKKVREVLEKLADNSDK